MVKQTPAMNPMMTKQAVVTKIAFLLIWNFVVNVTILKISGMTLIFLIFDSGLNILIFSNSNPNCDRSLFIEYINLIGLWDPKPNKLINTWQPLEVLYERNVS